MEIVSAVNDESVLSRNLLRSPMLEAPGVGLQLRRNYASAALAYQDAIHDSHSDLLVFTHQDVYLPRQWQSLLLRSITVLDEHDPHWAVLGIYGVQTTGQQVGCVWSSGLDAVFGREFAAPVPVESIDEVLIVLKRSSGVRFDPDLPGYHLYATDLVQTALSVGKRSYVVYAPVVHNSRPCLYLGSDYFKAYDHVARKWRSRLPILTNVAPIMKKGMGYARLRMRHQLNEWRYAGVNRLSLDRDYDCVGIARRLGFE